MGGHWYVLRRRALSDIGGVGGRWGQVTPGIWLGMGILWCTRIAQAATDAGLIPDWPREPDASPKDAQVGQPGREPPEGEMALLKGRV